MQAAVPQLEYNPLKTVIDEVHPSSNVTAACSGVFFDSVDSSHVLLAMGDILVLYEVRSTSPQFTLMHEFRLNEPCYYLSTLRLPSSEVDCFVVGYDNMRMVLLCIDKSFNLHTISTHDFRFHTLTGVPHNPDALDRTIYYADSLNESRCFGCVRGRSEISVVPLTTMPMFADIEVGNGKSYGKHGVREELESFSVDLEQYGVHNIRDILILDSFHDVTFAVLFEVDPSWEGRASVRKDTCSVLIFSVDIVRKSAMIFDGTGVDNIKLPSSAQDLVFLPGRPCCLVRTAESVVAVEAMGSKSYVPEFKVYEYKLPRDNDALHPIPFGYEELHPISTLANGVLHSMSGNHVLLITPSGVSTLTYSLSQTIALENILQFEDADDVKNLYNIVVPVEKYPNMFFMWSPCGIGKLYSLALDTTEMITEDVTVNETDGMVAVDDLEIGNEIFGEGWDSTRVSSLNMETSVLSSNPDKVIIRCVSTLNSIGMSFKFDVMPNLEFRNDSIKSMLTISSANSENMVFGNIRGKVAISHHTLKLQKLNELRYPRCTSCFVSKNNFAVFSQLNSRYFYIVQQFEEFSRAHSDIMPVEPTIGLEDFDHEGETLTCIVTTRQIIVVSFAANTPERVMEFDFNDEISSVDMSVNDCGCVLVKKRGFNDFTLLRLSLDGCEVLHELHADQACLCHDSNNVGEPLLFTLSGGVFNVIASDSMICTGFSSSAGLSCIDFVDSSEELPDQEEKIVVSAMTCSTQGSVVYICIGFTQVCEDKTTVLVYRFHPKLKKMLRVELPCLSRYFTTSDVTAVRVINSSTGDAYFNIGIGNLRYLISLDTHYITAARLGVEPRVSGAVSSRGELLRPCSLAFFSNLDVERGIVTITSAGLAFWQIPDSVSLNTLPCAAPPHQALIVDGHPIDVSYWPDCKCFALAIRKRIKSGQRTVVRAPDEHLLTRMTHLPMTPTNMNVPTPDINDWYDYVHLIDAFNFTLQDSFSMMEDAEKVSRADDPSGFCVLPELITSLKVINMRITIGEKRRSISTRNFDLPFQTKQCLVVGTTYSPGEDSQCRGRAFIFQVRSPSEMEAVDGCFIKLSKPRVNLERYGPVRIVSECDSYLLYATSTHITSYSLMSELDNIKPAGYEFNRNFISDIAVADRLVAVGDLRAGVSVRAYNKKRRNFWRLGTVEMGEICGGVSTVAFQIGFNGEIVLVVTDHIGNIHYLTTDWSKQGSIVKWAKPYNLHSGHRFLHTVQVPLALSQRASEFIYPVLMATSSGSIISSRFLTEEQMSAMNSCPETVVAGLSSAFENAHTIVGTNTVEESPFHLRQLTSAINERPVAHLPGPIVDIYNELTVVNEFF
ncbi:hypothetical protein PCE1_003499 [Barthelona sp. PCE]